MLSRTWHKALLESRSFLPPTYLCPWTSKLNTIAHAPSAASELPPYATSKAPSKAPSPRPGPVSNPPPSRISLDKGRTRNQRDGIGRSRKKSGSVKGSPIGSTSTSTPGEQARTSPLQLSPSIRELLPLMQAQGPHYMTAHIHGNPYLLTQGDTVRLPFLMQGVEPGDVIRLNRAVNLGNRDYTLKAPAPAPKLKSATKSTREIVDPTTGHLASHSQVRATSPETSTALSVDVPHFIPHIAKGKFAYVDDRLFVCRAVVMSVESEPLRIKEKTKRRQRHVRKVKSKHRFTVLKIKELRIKAPEEIDSGSSED